MNFKRVLVLVLALVMVVGTSLTPVFAAFNPETHHEHLHDVVENPEYQEKYEEIKSTVEYIVNDIEENHEEYYANGYAYALENGYIGTAIEAINATLEALDQVDLNGLGLTEELQGKLETEVDALVPTLEKLLAILESGEASEFDGFVNAVLTLEGDLYLHMNNIYAILEQGAIDVNQLVLVPAFNEALRLLNEEVLPAIDAAVEAFVDAVVDYVVEALTPYYNAVVETLEIAKEVYDRLVATIVMINLYVEGAIDTVVNAYNTLVGAILEVYGTVADAINAVCDLYNNVINAVVELNAKVENAIAKTKLFILNVTNAYRYTVNLLVHTYNEVKEAIIVASQICNTVIDFVVAHGPDFVNGVVDASKVLADVVEILINAYESREDVYTVIANISIYVQNLLDSIDAAIINKLNSAYEGNYELTDDSAYVSIGNADYADALAGKLNLADKHTVATFGSDYIDAIANADLITVKFDNGRLMELMEAQMEGKIAEIVTANTDLMAWYNTIEELKASFSNNKWLPAEYKERIVSGLTEIKAYIDFYVDVNAEVVELDWDKYLDEEGKEALDVLLAKVRAKVLEEGVPEYYVIDINTIINDLLNENGLGGIFDLSFQPIVIPEADLVVFAVENMLYAYAEFIDNLTYVLETASDDATIVLTPVGNPLYGYSFKGIDLSDLATDAEDIVDILNAHFYLVALVNENVVYVESEDADDIYNALNVYCDHVLSTCTDTECDRCLATVPAMGHSFTNYVFTASTTCGKNGTETATCDRCDATDTREVPGTAGEHDYSEATCKTLATCKICKATTGELAPHNYSEATCTALAKCSVCNQTTGDYADHQMGDWRTVKDPTSNSEGLREMKCKNCEYKITEAIPYNALSTIATVGIIVACVAVLGGVSALVAGILKKKNKI